MHDIETNQVAQDNALIAASYALTLNESRLLIAAISKINPASNAWKVGKCDITVTVDEWNQLFMSHSHSSYAQLRQAAFKLYERSLKLWSDEQGAQHIRWLSGWEYQKGEGRVVLTFAGSILYHLSGFIDHYTQYQVKNVSLLTSKHSVRLYQLASQFKNTGWRQINIVDLREMLQLGKRYPRWSDLRKRIVDNACLEISKKTELKLHYAVIKTGKRVVAVKLLIESK